MGIELDLRELIILGGAVLVVLVIGQGLWSAWSKHRNGLKMRIEPDLVPADDGEDWLRSDFPAGGARIVQAGEAAAEGGEAADQAEPDEPPAAPRPMEPELKPQEEDSLQGEVQASEPERQRPEPPAPAPAAKRREAPLAAVGKEASEEEDDDGALEEQALIVVHVLAPEGQRFAGDALLAALRAVGLKYGGMKIFHRLKPQSQKAVFSVANAVEPGYFDLGGDCSSPGVTAFLKLTGAEQDFDALDDLIRTTQSIADALGGALQDGDRRPFTDLTLEQYRGRVASFAKRQPPQAG